MFLNFPKNQRKIWQISAPESKKWSNHKITAPYSVFNTLIIPCNHRIIRKCLYFLVSRAICQIFRWFFGKFKNIKKTIWNYLTFSTCKTRVKQFSSFLILYCRWFVDNLSYLYFSGCSKIWSLFSTNSSEQLEFKWKKIIGT